MQTNPFPGPSAAARSGPPQPPVLPDAQWRVARCLGAGSSSSVWLVEQLPGGKRYALKMPLKQDTAAEGFELRRELAILSRYRHENLLGVEGVLAAAQGPGLLLEYAPGDSLARLLAVRGTLEPGEAVTVLVAVGRALACLHADGAAHGDVAPGNVLFTANGKPLLADFGTAKLLAEPGGTETGTPGFIAPDTAGAGAEGAGQAADIYALGALGWFMLTGRPLLPGLRPPLSVLLPELPAALRDLVDAALEDDPALRPAAGDFAARVLRTCAAEPVDLLPAVHASVRPELRTRRASGAGKRPRRRRLTGWRSRSKHPWEEGRTRTPSAARTVRTGKAWLVAATLLVGTTAGLGAVTLAAPQILRPDTAQVIPAAGGPPDQAAVETAESPAGAAEPSAEETAALTGDDPAAAARVLSQLRAEAFERGSTQLLRWVNAPGSAAETSDLEQVQALEERGERLEGLGIDVFRADPVAVPSRTKARVAVSASLSKWQQVRSDGSIAAPPGGPVQQAVLLELERTGQQWRITAVLPAAASLQEGAGGER